MVLSVLGKFKGSLRRTREQLKSGLERVLRGRARIDDDLFEELGEILISADVGVAASERILDRVKSRVRSNGVDDPGEIPRLLQEEIEEILEAGGNDVYIVRAEGKEILIPATDNVILQVDLDGGRMVVELPPGLVEYE